MFIIYYQHIYPFLVLSSRPDILTAPVPVPVPVYVYSNSLVYLTVPVYVPVYSTVPVQ